LELLLLVPFLMGWVVGSIQSYYPEKEKYQKLYQNWLKDQEKIQNLEQNQWRQG
jgi:hypothetical protein